MSPAHELWTHELWPITTIGRFDPTMIKQLLGAHGAVVVTDPGVFINLDQVMSDPSPLTTHFLRIATNDGHVERQIGASAINTAKRTHEEKTPGEPFVDPGVIDLPSALKNYLLSIAQKTRAVAGHDRILARLHHREKNSAWCTQGAFSDIGLTAYFELTSAGQNPGVLLSPNEKISVPQVGFEEVKIDGKHLVALIENGRAKSHEIPRGAMVILNAHAAIKVGKTGLVMI